MTQEKVDKSCKREDKKQPDDRKKDHPPSKIVIRRLPPSLNPEQFLEQVSPLPSYDFFYFVRADMSLGPHAFTRAYINFQNSEDVFAFRDKFDGYVFVDAKGNDYPAVVEFATFQKVPKKKTKKADSKKGTIELDSDYKRFLETLENPEAEPQVSLDTYLEELEEKERQNKSTSGNKIQTPLLDFLKKRKEERRQTFQWATQKLKDDHRKRKDIDRRRNKDDDRRRPMKDHHRDAGRDHRKRDGPRDRERGGRHWDMEPPGPPPHPHPREKERGGGDQVRRGERERQEETTPQHQQSQPVKLLKNPEREREKERELERDSAKNSGARENLRFSKENRERDRAEREKVVKGEKTPPPDKPRGGNKGGGGGRDKGRGGREDKYRSEDRPYSGRGSDSAHSGNRDRQDYKDRPRKDAERDKDKARTYRDGGNRDREHNPPRDREKDKEKRGGSAGGRREGGRGRGGGADQDNSSGTRRRPEHPPPAERDRQKAERTVEEKIKGSKESVKKEDDSINPPASSGESVEKVKAGSLSQGQAETNSCKEDDEGNGSDGKRKRKDRPERQLYVPRKALERRQQQQDTSSSKVTPSEGQGQEGSCPESKAKGQEAEEGGGKDRGDNA